MESSDNVDLNYQPKNKGETISSLYAIPKYLQITPNKKKIPNLSSEIIAASALKRFCAFVLDTLFISALTQVLSYITLLVFIRSHNLGSYLDSKIDIYPYITDDYSILFSFLFIIYFIGLEVFASGTLGKYIIGIKSIDKNGNNISIIQSIIWHFWIICYPFFIKFVFIFLIKILGEIIIDSWYLHTYISQYNIVFFGGVSFILGSAFSKKKRFKVGIHDIFANVRVVDRLALSGFSEHQYAKLNTTGSIVLFLSSVVFLSYIFINKSNIIYLYDEVSLIIFTYLY